MNVNEEECQQIASHYHYGATAVWLLEPQLIPRLQVPHVDGAKPPALLNSLDWSAVIL